MPTSPKEIFTIVAENRYRERFQCKAVCTDKGYDIYERKPHTSATWRVIKKDMDLAAVMENFKVIEANTIRFQADDAYDFYDNRTFQSVFEERRRAVEQAQQRQPQHWTQYRCS